VKQVVYLPRTRKFQLISHWSEDFVDFKRSFLFQSNLFVMVHFQIPCVKPYLLALFKWGEI
jgi:hypothetical protein